MAVEVRHGVSEIRGRGVRLALDIGRRPHCWLYGGLTPDAPCGQSPDMVSDNLLHGQRNACPNQSAMHLGAIMRYTPSSSLAALSLLRFLVVAALLIGATPGGSAAATARIGDSGPRIAAAGITDDIVVPRQSVLQAERAAKKDVPAEVDIGSAPASRTVPMPAQQAGKGAALIRAPPHNGSPLLRPEPRAPPLSI